MVRLYGQSRCRVKDPRTPPDGVIAQLGDSAPPIDAYSAVMGNVMDKWERDSVVIRYRAALSPREREVLDALAAGASQVEIAMQLGVRRTTVSAHLMRLYRRLGVSGEDVRANAIVRARHLGLLP